MTYVKHRHAEFISASATPATEILKQVQDDEANKLRMTGRDMFRMMLLSIVMLNLFQHLQLTAMRS